MDPLTQLLLQRAQAPAGQPQDQAMIPQAQAQVPVTPPSPTTRVPTKVQRFANAQQLMAAYRSNWNPNPILLQAQLKG